MGQKARYKREHEIFPFWVKKCSLVQPGNFSRALVSLKVSVYSLQKFSLQRLLARTDSEVVDFELSSRLWIHRFSLDNNVFLQGPVTNLLLRNSVILIQVGGEGLLWDAPGGLRNWGITVVRVDGTKTGRVPMVSKSIFWINRFETKWVKINKIL